ncbi:MAG: GNAT family N-acetyltransferase [Flavobacteriaceae bacterium]
MEYPKIRFAKKEDLDSIVRLCEQHAIFENAPYNPSDKIQKLDRYLFSNNPCVYCLVVEKGNNLIGYATYMKQFSTWDSDFYIYMDCLFMTEESRGFGIGEKLINKIKLEGVKNQCTHIQWQTPDFNKRAIKFYNRIGAESKSKERFFLKV